MAFNGIGSIADLFRISSAKSRSISPENMTGEVGGGARCPASRARSPCGTRARPGVEN